MAKRKVFPYYSKLIRLIAESNRSEMKFFAFVMASFERPVPSSHISIVYGPVYPSFSMWANIPSKSTQPVPKGMRLKRSGPALSGRASLTCMAVISSMPRFSSLRTSFLSHAERFPISG